MFDYFVGLAFKGLRNKHILKKVIAEITPKVKLMSGWTLFLILLTSAVNKHLDFLHGKEVAQYLLNYKCPRLHRTNIERLLHIWTKESKNCNLLTACIILWVVEFFDYFCFFKVLYFFMTVNYVNALYHAIDACDHETIIRTGVACKKISCYCRKC